MIEILLVDDEVYVTESLRKTIPWERMGVGHVYTADSAAAALRMLEEREVDILVSDIRMPETDGLELVRMAGEQWPHLRCLLLTGHSDFEYAKKAIELRVSGYILKPVDDDEFVRSVTDAIASLRDEWEQAERYNRLLYDLKSDRALLRERLMHDLLLGRQLPSATLADKLRQYEVPIAQEAPALMLQIRLGGHFAEYDAESLSLMEYAVGNIAEEVLGSGFRVWHSKAPHDCLVLLATVDRAADEAGGIAAKPIRAELERLAAEIGRQVRNYLKGSISIVVSPWFLFPEELASAYRSGLTALFEHAGARGEAALFLEDLPRRRAGVQSLESLYKPPTLIHLLESKQWEAAEEKIADVLGDLERMEQGYTDEHLYEVYLCIANACLYLAHKQGLLVAEIDGGAPDPAAERRMLQSPQRLRAWSLELLAKLKRELSESDTHTRSRLVKQVRELVTRDIGLDISVKTIADKVYLHPVYLSKVYKSETGESLGDYIIRIRMEKALYLLKHTNKKIYEITTELGYQNPQYFSKMFKKFYGMTPNAYRD
ncbi:response regulator [Cohnella sp. REN36]|uniref:response regulator n=1 Tax=Cohnella sp. REN36 TaxID=2887347 RepID=UPI001D1499B8|nr:response regulator [Cohnella sp. REN36]MCC3376403.1 response regulator [Cohnella sp. REN36]